MMMKAEKMQSLQPLEAKELESVTGGIIPPLPTSGGEDTSWDSATGGSGAVKTKICPKCGKEIPEAQYPRHVLQCKPSTGTTK